MEFETHDHDIGDTFGVISDEKTKFFDVKLDGYVGQEFNSVDESIKSFHPDARIIKISPERYENLILPANVDMSRYVVVVDEGFVVSIHRG